MRDKIDFKKIVYQREWIGVLNFNLMIPVEDSLIQKIDTRIRRHDNMDTREQCLDFKRMKIECKKFTGYPFLLSAEGRRVLGSVI